MVINPEAGLNHIQPIDLRDAIYARPDDVQAVAAAVREKVTPLQTTLGEITLPTPAQWFGNRGHGSQRFVDRMTEFWSIHTALHRREAVMVIDAHGMEAAQVRGLAGTGKSLLVEEYGLRFGAAYPGGVFWLFASCPRECESAVF